MYKSLLKKIFSLNLDSTIVIGLFTAFSYYSTYLYEVAYCDGFRISNDFVTVEFSNILTHMSKILIMGSGLVVAIYFISLLQNKFENKWPNATRFFSMYLSMALMTGIVCYLAGEWPTVTLLLLMFTVASIGALSLTYSIKKEALDRQNIVNNALPHNISNRLRAFDTKKTQNLLPTFLILVVILFLLESLDMGHSAARNKTQFYVLASSPTTIVLRTYGDKLVCGQYDDKHKTLTGKLILIKISESTPIELLPKSSPPLAFPRKTLLDYFQ